MRQRRLTVFLIDRKTGGVVRKGWLVVALVLTMIAAPAQTTGSDRPTHRKLPEWDVTLVKPAQPENCPQGSGIRTTSDGLSAFCVPLLFVIETAYQVMDSNRVIGMPEWVRRGQEWNIDGKVAANDTAIFAGLSRDEQFSMLQPLLAERFHLKAHNERRPMPVFELVVAKGGPKLKHATQDEIGKSRIVGGNSGRIEGVSAELDSLPSLLSREVGRPVVNRTGLTGRFDFTLEYLPATRAAADEIGGQSLFTALEEKLGLRLKSARELMDVLVIDSITQPSEN
jgi:uncharacterized protein (TIGR03435 family)